MSRVGCIFTAERVSKMASKDVRRRRKKGTTRRQKQKRKLIVFAIEILCLFIVLGLLYVWSIFSKIDHEEVKETGINKDLSSETVETLSGYTNIAIFGLDNRTKEGDSDYTKGHSDVIMIASIDNATKEVKLVSVYRDTYLSVGDGKFNKANSAYMKGGPEQAIQMLNANLDLNITEYVSVDWAAVIKAVDALGGVEIDVTDAEVKYLNRYVRDMSREIGSSGKQIKSSGKQTLNGAQATAYARIRYTSGNDFKRASRQRIVIGAMLEKAKQADAGTLVEICNLVFPHISTSIGVGEIIELAGGVADYKIVSTTGFPFEMTTKDLTSGDTVIPIGLTDDVSMLHEYLFGTVNYEPSMTVQAISDSIIEKTGVDPDDPSIDVSDFNNTAGESGTSFKKEEDTQQ